jgi:hypothetical protein
MKSGGLFLAMNQSPPARAKQSLNSSVAAPSDFQGAEFPRNLKRRKLAPAIRTLSIQCTKHPFANNLFPLNTFH